MKKILLLTTFIACISCFTGCSVSNLSKEDYFKIGKWAFDNGSKVNQFLESKR
jgi:hypothetical protein